MICKGYSLIVINQTILTSLFSPQRPLFVFLFSGKRKKKKKKKRKRPGDVGKRNEVNIGYIQSSSQIRRHLEMHYRAERSAPDPIGLNSLVSLWSLQNIVFFIASTLDLDEILLSKCSSKFMSLQFLRKKKISKSLSGYRTRRVGLIWTYIAKTITLNRSLWFRVSA